MTVGTLNIIFEGPASCSWTSSLVPGRQRWPSGLPAWNESQWSCHLLPGSVPRCHRSPLSLSAPDFSQTGQQLQKKKKGERERRKNMKCIIGSNYAILTHCILYVVALSSSKHIFGTNPAIPVQVSFYGYHPSIHITLHISSFIYTIFCIEPGMPKMQIHTISMY